MTITLFVTMLTIGSSICMLVTEAIKKSFENAGKTPSPNMIALIDSVLVGGVGTTICYVLLDIPFTPKNIICLVLMIFVVWIGSMIGFDKVKQLLDQIKE